MTYNSTPWRSTRRRLRDNPYHRPLSFTWILIPVVIFVLIFGFVGCRRMYQNTETTIHTTVISKERVCDSSGDGVKCQYLVFTEDGTFKLTDMSGLLSGKTRYRTSDVYGRIHEGPATITYMGWRIGFFSEYPNIIDITQE